MASRRPHKKSRKGCRECKSRHIKCDEVRPVCGGCSKKELSCVYVQTPAEATLPDQAHHHRLPELRSDSTCTCPGRLDSLSPLGSTSPAPSPALSEHAQHRSPTLSLSTVSVSPANMAQLELFHHASSQQLPLLLPHNDEKIRSMLLEAACVSPCLMNALLASYYRDQAAQLHIHALSLFNQNKPQVTPDNCLSLIMFIHITSLQMLYETTESCNNIDTIEPLDRFLEYTKVYRGAVLVAKEGWGALLQSNLAHIFTAGSNLADHRAAEGSQMQTIGGSQTTELRSVILISQTLDREQKQLLIEEVDRLQLIFSSSEHEQASESEAGSGEPYSFRSLSLIHLWPCLAHEVVLQLLWNKAPEALLMLAYYGVLMHQNRHFWTYANLGHVLVRSIGRYLGPDWQHFMAWPLEEIDRDLVMKEASSFEAHMADLELYPEL